MDGFTPRNNDNEIHSEDAKEHNQIRSSHGTHFAYSLNDFAMCVSIIPVVAFHGNATAVNNQNR